MRRLLSLFAFFLAVAFSLPALADHLDGVLPLHKDDIAADLDRALRASA